MMVVETMRKENISLERSLVAKERANEESRAQLRQVSQKARQLQKVMKTKSSQKGLGQKIMLEMQGPSQQSLPPLSQRSVDTPGRRSGQSTPRASYHGTR